MISRPRICVAIAAAALASFGDSVAHSDFLQDQSANGGPQPLTSTNGNPKPGTTLGDPLPGLTTAQLADFAAGLDEFQDEDTPESGLGPIFNNVSCVACHSTPAPGGASAILETRFGSLVNGQFDPLTALGGSLLQQSAIDPAAQEVIPPQANVVAKRLTTPLFGAGLIEAIPDSAILANTRTRQPDGISGRASMVTDVASGEARVGRFGWKAQQATLLAFAGDAYVNEMGITNRLFPHENAPNGNAALLAQYDAVGDPEDAVDPATGKADIDRFADFMRLLAPPPPLPLTSAAKAGKTLFAQIACNACHLPNMGTGPNSIAALDRKPVPLYSDLLLHDMGALGDGIAQGTATPLEMRTAPLWGLHARGPYLHDGRAATVDAAIGFHDGQAAAARNRYNLLSATQKQQLLEFLGSI
jgi:CxxC motif-containing protein (DUF1111 family)